MDSFSDIYDTDFPKVIKPPDPTSNFSKGPTYLWSDSADSQDFIERTLICRNSHSLLQM